MIKIFVYGSLLNINSLANTASKAIILGEYTLKGYLRILNKPSKKRGCAMNLKQSVHSETRGLLIGVSENEYELLCTREVAYTVKTIVLEGGVCAKVFIYYGEPTRFNIHEKKQRDYLLLCWEGVKQCSKELQENFEKTRTNRCQTVKKFLYGNYVS